MGRKKIYTEEEKEQRNKESRKRWREKNKDRLREYNKKWKEENPEKEKEHQKKWDSSDRGKEISKKWELENKEYRDEYRKNWYIKNKNILAEKHKKWAKENKDKLRINRQKRNSKIKNLPFLWNKKYEEKMLIYFGNKCCYCNQLLTESWHIDHFYPISKYNIGTVPHNLLPSCQHCNISKNNKEPEEFVIKIFGIAPLIKIFNYFEGVYNVF